jgi:N-acetyl-anhydromuramyl-L-alanine amidase AmpD
MFSVNIQIGQRGEAVKQVQERLVAHGFIVTVDGVFGPMTQRAVRQFQLANSLTADGIVGVQTMLALQKPVAVPVETDLNFIELPLRPQEYFTETVKKDKIVIHHTAGSGIAQNVHHGWNSDGQRIGTPFLIDAAGRIFRMFDEENGWAWHLGVGSKVVDSSAIGIELTNWGWLNRVGDRYTTYVNSTVPASNVVEYSKPFRGYRFYEKYTDAQISSLKVLLKHLTNKYNITFNKGRFDEKEGWFDVRSDARGAGIWNHTNYRRDKWDMHPQKELIDMLNSL